MYPVPLRLSLRPFPLRRHFGFSPSLSYTELRRLSSLTEPTGLRRRLNPGRGRGGFRDGGTIPPLSLFKFLFVLSLSFNANFFFPPS